MPLIHLEGLYLLLAITVGCFVFQLSGALIALAIPDKWYAKDHRMFHSWKFEQNGLFYNRVFHIARWKKYLPDGGTYKKKHLQNLTLPSLEKYVIESKRAELSHVLGFYPFILFILFTPWYMWPILFVYALLVNLPCWMAQRFNRPRVLHYMATIQNKKTVQSTFANETLEEK